MHGGQTINAQSNNVPTLLPILTRRLDYYRWLVALFVIITVFASWSLWSSDRTCPTAPLLGIHSYISGNLGLVWRGALIIGAIFFALKVRYSDWFLAALFIVTFADDLNRLLPNTYQFVIILVLFALSYKYPEDKLLSSFRIIQAGVYVWTGLLKLNMGYVNLGSDFIYKALQIHHPPVYLKYVALLVAIWEVAIGLSFLTGKGVKAAVLSSFVLHAAISSILFIAHWNRAFITYNVFLAAGNLILFSKSTQPLINEVEYPKYLIQKIAIALFILLPALNVVHCWPDFMSSGMYSYHGLYAVVYIDNNLKKQLPDAAQKAIFNSPNGRYLTFSNWMETETGTVTNPQQLVYEKMYAQLRMKYQCTDSVRLVLYY